MIPCLLQVFSTTLIAAIDTRPWCASWQVLMAMGGIRELEDAWKLRDAGFGCIVVGQ